MHWITHYVKTFTIVPAKKIKSCCSVSQPEKWYCIEGKDAFSGEETYEFKTTNPGIMKILLLTIKKQLKWIWLKSK